MFATPASSIDVVEEEFFLHQVEATIENVLSKHGEENILELPSESRESLGIARNLNRRLQGLRRNNDCPRCWMQRAHCICDQCPPISSLMLNPKSEKYNMESDAASIPGIRRIFLLLHHKEIGMKIDTAKLILAAFPEHCRLVVAGIGSEYQDSMRELEECLKDNGEHCLILFPDEDAMTFSEIYHPAEAQQQKQDQVSQEWDVVVLDGTWAQARKMHSRYFPSLEDGGPMRAELSQTAVESLRDGSTNSGHQLRRHEIAWRQVGTFEATRLFLNDVVIAQDRSRQKEDSSLSLIQNLKAYQEIANQAAIRELGPPRDKNSSLSRI